MAPGLESKIPAIHLVEYQFDISDKEALGPLTLEIVGATDLPKLKNSNNKDGWDDDPYAIVTLSDQVFHTKAVTHNLNPVWNENVTFKVLKSHLADPAKAQVHFTIMDLDKKSPKDDHIGTVILELSKVLADESVPQPDAKTGLYPDGKETAAATLKEIKLPVTASKEATVNAKHPASVTVRVKFQPHAATRQKTWREHLKQGDANKVTRADVTKLGSTLHLKLDAADIDKFFKQQGAAGEKAGLTVEEIVAYLENTVGGMNVPYPDPPPQPAQYRIIVQSRIPGAKGALQTTETVLTPWVDGVWGETTFS